MVRNVADSRPFFAIYIAWHPCFSDGESLAKALYQHFRRDLFSNVAGGVGLSVLYRSAHEPGSDAPSEVSLSDTHVAAVLLLVSKEIEESSAWSKYVTDLIGAAASQGLTTRVIPIAVDGGGLAILQGTQAVRWDRWPGNAHDKRLHLISVVTHELCRLLRTYIAYTEHPHDSFDLLETYLEPARVFLSHSKHDPYGEAVVDAIRAYLADDTALASFFDVRDIPAGLLFSDVLVRYVRTSAVVAVYTDSYSSREWCRREIIEAKRANVPLVIANCITDVDERGFPYLGNVPVVRMEPRAVERIPNVIARLLDEVFKDYLWTARLATDGRTERDDQITFLPRPPELIALVGISSKSAPQTIVYPDPPLGIEELQLFGEVCPTVVLRSYIEWAAESGGAP